VAPRPTADPVVRQAQTALAAARFDPGPIDGVMGAKTRQAIRDFQTARRLAPSGELDNATRAALGIR
jgi:peptidoglycan hydrolase-like protein with peptidoglycan-binding domain